MSKDWAWAAPKMAKELKEAKQRIRDLERALKPFAQEATNWSEQVSNGFHPGVTEPKHKFAHAKAEFTVGHLRRAHKLVATA